jgi:formylglycine-generating enzyme
MATSRAQTDQVIAPKMVRIAAGSFLMGCDSGRDDEKPAHRVTLDAFEIAAYQVTNAEYALFLAAADHPEPPVTWKDPNFNLPRQPAVSVSWFDATAYCEWLSQITGHLYTLPTEAQWEFAARGGKENELYPWGNCAPQDVPNYAQRWKNGTEVVGLYARNAFGIFNMGDNVHEWCSDWYSADYYSHSPEHDPRGPETGVRKASRGGSWRHQIKVTRTAARSSIPPDFKYADYGFRLTRTIR